jgi:hypothetical protein
MDVTLLHRLTRAVDGSSRRRVMRTALGGIALAAASQTSAPESVAGKNKKNKRKKKTNCPDRPVRTDCPTCQECPPPCVGAGLGEACQSIKDCCGNETGLSCGRTEDSSGETVCCGMLGAPCVGDADCCLPFFCPDGQCVAP